MKGFSEDGPEGRFDAFALAAARAAAKLFWISTGGGDAAPLPFGGDAGVSPAGEA